MPAPDRQPTPTPGVRPTGRSPEASTGGAGQARGTDPAGAQRLPRPAAVSLPKGGGAVRGVTEKFAVNPANGTATLSIPLPLSPARDFGPTLSLTYDSGAGNGSFGIGWSLDSQSITRRTDRGLPRYLDGAGSDTYILAGAEDLVPVPAAGGDASTPRTWHDVDYDVFGYRPRIEGLYARIERWVRRGDGATHWRTISGDNIVTLFGFDPGSTIANGARVFSWLACRRYDNHGNVISYTYWAENGAGVDRTSAHERNRAPADRTRARHLKAIRYGNQTPCFPDWATTGPEPALPTDWLFELVLDYGEHDQAAPTPGDAGTPAVRPDPYSSSRAGFEVRNYRRVRRALMFHHFPNEPEVGADCLVRSLDFQYSDEAGAPDPTAPIYSKLTSVVEVGYRRTAGGYLRRALPALRFQYSEAVIDPTSHALAPADALNLPEGIDGTRYRVVDLDGSGAPGILSEDQGAWHYRANLSPATLAAPDDGVRAWFAPPRTLPAVPADHVLASGLRLLDLSAGGRLDLVNFAPGAATYSRRLPRDGWEPPRSLASMPNLDWSDPQLQFVDLTGDGRPDILLSEEELLCFHPSLGEAGYGPAEYARAPWDDDQGARVVFSAPGELVALADMSGDGLPDVVRVRDTGIAYWPNLGYARFGPMVTMDHPPRFADASTFDPRRVRLVDIDGSGTTDVLYLAGDGVWVSFNQSGNSWADPVVLTHLPDADLGANVSAFDLLGVGTACLVWSSALPDGTGAVLRYVNLMTAGKPHMLTATANNLGAETRLHYLPSTTYAISDELAGSPWVTQLPFCVHVVDRLETYDWISRSRYVNRFAYHHGYFDPYEREFRGFGMVEEWDTDEHRTDSLFPVSNWDDESFSPPVLVRTWYHTGAFDHLGDLVARYKSQYWAEPAAGVAVRGELLLPAPLVPADLDPDELREAHRALKGLQLRVETYADDGTPEAVNPYSVVETTYEVICRARRGANQFAVFAAHQRERVTMVYERDTTDPRVSHDVTLAVNEVDQPTRTMAVAYPRRTTQAAPEPGLAAPVRDALAADQARLHLTGVESQFTQCAPGPDHHRNPLPAQTMAAELDGVCPGGAVAGGTNLFSFAELAQAWDDLWAGAHDLAYEDIPAPVIDGTPVAGPPTRRIVEWVRARYRREDLTDLYPLGTAGPLALPGEQYRLALTPTLLDRVFGAKVTGPDLQEGGYVQQPDHPGWWIPSGRDHYSPGDADPPAVELAEARAHFYRVRRRTDPFGAILRDDFDTYDLSVARAVDAVGNEYLADHDYRVLEPARITDPNGNRAEVAFDALGHVVGSAIRGKVGDGLGDDLGGFEPDLPPATVAAHLADPLADPGGILGRASARMVYDLDAFARDGSPAVVYTLDRETHVSELAPGASSRYRHTFEYSDGNGQRVGHKAQAEPGPLVAGGAVAGGAVVSPRWVGTGWVVLDNKGRTVRRYEPFFSDTHAFESGAIHGVSTVTMYDPLGRVVAALHPDDTWEKTVFDPWREQEWDRNDTVSVTDPRTDPDVGDRFARLLDGIAYTSWHDQRSGGLLGTTPADRAANQDAAAKAAAHANTPTVEHLDALGRPVLIVRDFGGERAPLRTVFDAESAMLAQVDALGRRVIEYLVREPAPAGGTRYVATRDLAGRELFHNHIDGGPRWVLPDVTGHLLASWDAKGHAVRMRYDAARRPTHRFVRAGNAAQTLDFRTVYGEGRPGANLCGLLWRHYDQSGLTENTQCDYMGNLTVRARTFARDYRTDPDWTPLANLTTPADLDAAGAALLVSADRFTAEVSFDAFTRPLQVATPHSATIPANVVQAQYNEAGLVERVDVWEQVGALPAGLLDPNTANIHVVTNVDYDAHGRPIRFDYGNGTVTTEERDPQTFRVTRVRTTRSGAFPADQRVVVDMNHAYDPVGNVTRTRDDADIHNTVYFRNQRVDPSADYTYDAGYRLVRATGREHLGQSGAGLAAPTQVGPEDGPRGGLLHPGDGNAMGRYTETYSYDPLGNLLTLIHQVASGSWTRHHTYAEASQVEPGRMGNRLSATSMPGDAPAGPYSAGYTYDANGNTATMAHLSRLEWDEQNQLRATATQVVAAGVPESTYYTYDAAGQRMRKVTDRAGVGGNPGTRRKERLYIGPMEVYREYGPDGTTLTLVRVTHLISAARRTTAVLERRLVGVDPAPARMLRYQHTNQVSTTVLELDDTGAVISYEETFPWGATAYQAVRALTDTPKRLRFAGKERDEESGLSYFGARYYAPWLGRWLSVDPELLGDGPNGYLYCHANPIIVVDPTGTVGLILGLGAYELAVLGAAACVAAMGVITAQNVQRGRMPTPTLPDWEWPKPAPSPPVPSPSPAPPVAPPIPAPPPPIAPPVAPPIPVPPPTLPIPIPADKPVAPPMPIPRPEDKAGPKRPPAPNPKKDPKKEPKKDPKPGPKKGPKPVDPLPDGRPRRRQRPQLRYVTYRKYNPRTGRVYVGRTMGYGDPRAIVAARDANHHMTAKGYGPARLDKWLDATKPHSVRWSDPSYRAIRGREQQLIDKYGGAISDVGKANTRSGNAIRGVSAYNPLGRKYHDAATKAFGQAHKYTGWW